MFMFMIIYVTNVFEDNHIFLFNCLHYIQVQYHISDKSGKSAIHDRINSCKECHSCSISNFCIISHANTHFETKVKEALYI